jgi:UDP-N-acetylglucosamine 2-epimerase (non-hydrolysing)
MRDLERMNILIIFGTRPECVKLAPIIKELERQQISHKVCVTAQHRQMLDPFLSFFDIRVDHDLGIMKPNQDLYHVTTAALEGLRDVLRAERPDVVIVQGDTTTTFAAALAAFYERIPVAHVEAGLRTHKPYSPFPEEMNRRLTDHLSTWLFSPTEHAKQNLLSEGFPPERIFVTGNTVVDALLMILRDERFQELEPPVVVPDNHRLILVTAHRRESFGQGIENICRALRELVDRYQDVEIVYPVHLNPNVQEPVRRMLGGVERVHLLKPLEYLSLLKLMDQAYLILTDSGGIQEEAPTLRKPVLVLREVTERPEGVQVGVARLVRTETEHIVRETQRLLEDRQAYKAMCPGPNPYGDGHASERITKLLMEAF